MGIRRTKSGMPATCRFHRSGSIPDGKRTAPGRYGSTYTDRSSSDPRGSTRSGAARVGGEATAGASWALDCNDGDETERAGCALANCPLAGAIPADKAADESGDNMDARVAPST